jgi:hypothetical protein
MNRIIRNAAIGSAATLALLGATTAPALADATSTTSGPATVHRTLAEIQASAKVKTDARTASLNKAISKITAAKGISADDRSTILATLNADLAGMTTVEAKIAGDTDATTAATDYKTIFTTYRVYAVAIPQSRFAATADRLVSTTIPRLTDAHDKLAAKLAADPSTSTPALVADLADMSTQLSAASSGVDGVAAGSLAVTPAAYNSNHDVLEPDRSAVKNALAAVKKAASDAKTVLAALR